MEERSTMARSGIVALLLFGSGFCALVYQTVWLRELRDVFGASTAATAAVVGIFMAGLGVGGLRLGRLADRTANPLNLYALLEGGVTIAALATMPLLFVVEKIYYSTGGSVSLGIPGATLFRLMLAVVILGPATFLMGGTLPAAARSVVGGDDVRRRSIAMLYGVNTLGAVVGAVVSTFLALELFGNQKTLILATLINALVVVSARAHARGTTVAPDSEDTPARAADGTEVSRPFVLGAAVVTGFVFMLMEMVWYRVLAPVLGGSTFTFGLILATALAGIGIGGLAYSVYEGRRPATATLFSLTCAAEALAIVIPYALGDRLAILAALLQPLEALGFTGKVSSWALISSIVVIPASAVAGFQFPVLIGLAGRGKHGVGRDVGRVYAFNTAGAIAGSLGGGFGLMPLLSAEGCWSLSVWIMAVAAVVSFMVAFRHHERAWSGIAVALLSAVLLLGSEGPSAVWRHSPIGAGRMRETFETSEQLKAWVRETKRAVVWQSEGVESSVAIVSDTGYAFLINGKVDGHAIQDAGTQVMSGLIGAIQHENPRRSLVIGLGTGSTAGWLAAVPGMERVDVAELESDVLHVAEVCAPVNENVLEKENVSIIIGDAREILLATDEEYDIIFSEPSNPYRSGIASLFTREFYEASEKRLRPGGMFLQWVQGYEISPRTLETIFLTLREVFPHIQIWQTSGEDILLAASIDPFPIRVSRIRERLAQEPYRRAASAAWRVTTVEEFLAHFVADQRLIDLAIDPSVVEVNTDDRNVVEFGFARSVGVRGRGQVAGLRDSARRLDIDQVAPEEIDPKALRRFRASSVLLSGGAVERNRILDQAASAYGRGDHRSAVRFWEQTGMTPSSHTEILMFAHSLAQIGDERCFEMSDALAPHSETEANLVRGVCVTQQIDAASDDAARYLTRGLTSLRTDPWVDSALVVRVLFKMDALYPRVSADVLEPLVEAIAEPFSVSMVEEQRRLAFLRAARRVESDRCGEQTVRALHAFEPHVPWSREMLRVRATCYASSADPLTEIARSEYEEYLRGVVEPFGDTTRNATP